MKHDNDELLRRYHEANAHDPARPNPALREKVLAQARAAASTHTAPGAGRPHAANDTAWRWRALGGLAMLGLATLVVLQFDRGASDERELALGQAPAPQAAPAAPAPVDEAMAGRETAPSAHMKAVPPPSSVDAAPAQAPATPPAPAPHAAPTPPPAPDEAPAAAESAVPPTFSAAPQAQDAETRASAPAGVAAAPRARSQERNEAPAALSSRRAAPPPDAALLAAVARGTLAEARDAIAQGADVNASDTNGRTALMRAALRGDAPLVRLLLDTGADPRRTDRDGLRAADLAQQSGHNALLPLLDGIR